VCPSNARGLRVSGGVSPSVGYFLDQHVRPQTCWLSQMSSHPLLIWQAPQITTGNKVREQTTATRQQHGHCRRPKHTAMPQASEYIKVVSYAVTEHPAQNPRPGPDSNKLLLKNTLCTQARMQDMNGARLHGQRHRSVPSKPQSLIKTFGMPSSASRSVSSSWAFGTC